MELAKQLERQIINVIVKKVTMVSTARNWKYKNKSKEV